jgi:acetyl-CoA carboxylase biotin carboxyl carrier protein
VGHVNVKKVEEVIRLMERHNLTEISIEEEGMKIHLKKGQGGHIEKAVQLHSPVLTPVTEVSPPPVREQPKNVVEIKAPMVGTFYRSPAPDAQAFVDIGRTIQEGDVLCIIEAMKLMNEIKSEITGKIVDVVVDSGEPVEFGQTLFLVEPA